MRRRRKRTGIWLPNHGTPGDEDIGFPGSSTRWTTFSIGVNDPGPLTGVVPLLFDTPSEVDDLSESAEQVELGFFIKNAYFLKRIVGSIFAVYNPVTKTTAPPATIDDLGPPAVQCTVGLFIARAGDAVDDNTGLGNTMPIGGTALYNRDYNPDSRDCIREPWIWRRSWLLGNPLRRQSINHRFFNLLSGSGSLAGTEFGGYSELPTTNTQYGSVADGPKCDAKTRRRVSSDDRLWAAVTVRAMPYKWTPTGATNTNDQNVDVGFDLRFFGNPMKDRNRGNF